MRVKFQADADLDQRVLRGIKRTVPDIDFQTATQAGLEGLPDPEVLHIAAEQGRILVSQDRRTMPVHFRRFISTMKSPGVILLREGISITAAIEELVLIWAASEPQDWENRLVWIPL